MTHRARAGLGCIDLRTFALLLPVVACSSRDLGEYATGAEGGTDAGAAGGSSGGAAASGGVAGLDGGAGAGGSSGAQGGGAGAGAVDGGSGGSGGCATKSTAWKKPSNFASKSAGTPWASLALAQSSDDAYASVNLTAPGSSQVLAMGNFDLAVPSGATVLGFEVQIEGSATGEVVDDVVRFAMVSQATGVNHAKETQPWPATDVVVNYGSASDSWGIQDLSPTKINVAEFELWLAIKSNSSGGARIDEVSIRAHYATCMN